MKKLCAFLLTFCFFAGAANAEYSYRMQKKMLKNNKSVKKKVINAQIKGKLQAIQEQIEKLTNSKMCIKQEYKNSLRALKASR